MNNRGQSNTGLGISIIVAIMVFLVGLTVVNFITGEVTNTRATVTGLECAYSNNISDGTKLTCLAVDMVVPYFIILVFSAATGYITARFLI